MLLEIVIPAVAGAVFFAAKIFLVIKERARGKSGTAINRRTRTFNFIPWI